MHKKLKDIIFPKGSKIRYILVLIKQTISNIKQNGLKDTLKKIKSYDLKSHGNNEQAYQNWIRNYEPNEEKLQKQRETKFENMPKISVVVPLYNTQEIYFEPLIDHMIKQTYENWELCLADGSPEQNLHITKLAQKDKRIIYKYLGENLGIAGNTNAAIELATGEYIGLLDHDDLLADFALYEVVQTINKHPEVEFIYSDEDKISDEREGRFDPHFKPDFAIDTLRSLNYICHFSVIKTELIKKLGGFRSGFDGAQDYDLILRIAENTKNIIHIPQILYHWRVHTGSTAAAVTGEAKPYAYVAGKKAIESHLQRIGLSGKVEHGETLGTYKITYDVKQQPKISILIPNKDHVKDLKTCIQSILKLTTYNNYEILIIENNSTQKDTFEYYKELQKAENIRVLEYPEQGFNYSKIINYGVQKAEGEYILQLNNDTELLTPDWLEQFLGYAQREDVGAVGAKLYYPDNTIQHAGIIVGTKGTAGHILRNMPKHKKAYLSRESYVQNFTAVTGACLFTRKSIYEEVGYMDEKFQVALNDIDFCLKIREKGYWIVWNPYIELKHFESKSRGYENTEEKQARYQNEINLYHQKWPEILKNGDPFFNINFDINTEEYKIKGGT